MILIILFAYNGVQDHEFLNFDDNIYVTNNGHVKNGFSIEGIRWAFGFTGVAYWHPLTWISHMLDCRLFGLSSGAHHLVNLAIHILNALLIYLLINRMTGASYKAAVVALLFAVHPVNVESVSWVAERKNVLSMLFLMAALYYYILYTQEKKGWIYGIILFFYTFGLLSKPSIVIFPFLLLILDYWPLGRFGRGDIYNSVQTVGIFFPRRVLAKIFAFRKSDAAVLFLEKVPFIILSLISSYLSMISMSKFQWVINYDRIPLDLRIYNLFVSITKYLWKMVWPFDLSIFYSFPQSIPAAHFILALSFVVLITFATFMWRISRPWLVVGWFWFLIALAPASGIIQAGLWPEMANRFMYIPIIGLFLILVWECDARIRGLYSNTLKIILCCAVLIYFVSLTKFQNIYFSNSYAVFQRAIEVTGGNSIAYNNFGVALTSLNRIDEAAEYFAKAIALDSKYDDALKNYGLYLFKKGDYITAGSYFSRIITFNPNYVDAYINMGFTEYRLGRPQEAIRHFKKALEIKPNDIEAYYNLSQVYEKEALYNEAVTMYEVIIKMKPTEKGIISYRIAGVYAQQNKLEECIHYLEMSLKHGFDVFGHLKTDERFEAFRETAIYTQLLENKGVR